jgi:hypothetical protein
MSLMRYRRSLDDKCMRSADIPPNDAFEDPNSLFSGLCDPTFSTTVGLSVYDNGCHCKTSNSPHLHIVDEVPCLTLKWVLKTSATLSYLPHGPHYQHMCPIILEQGRDVTVADDSGRWKLTEFVTFDGRRRTERFAFRAFPTMPRPGAPATQGY